jgi:hypothetical protein
MISLTIRGIQEAQRDNLKLIAAMRPEGALGRAVKAATVRAHLGAVRKTHVLTGALRASHRIVLQGLEGRVYIDPGSVNPKGDRPAQYGPVEEARGGSHAFYLRAVTEDANAIAMAAGMALRTGISWL